MPTRKLSLCLGVKIETRCAAALARTTQRSSGVTSSLPFPAATASRDRFLLGRHKTDPNPIRAQTDNPDQQKMHLTRGWITLKYKAMRQPCLMQHPQCFTTKRFGPQLSLFSLPELRHLAFTAYAISVKMDQWRRKDVHRPAMAGRVNDMSAFHV